MYFPPFTFANSPKLLLKFELHGMENVNVIPISDLLRRRRPVAGAASLRHSNPPSTSGQLSDDSRTLNPSTVSHTKILNSLSKPSIVIGTLSLPNVNNSLSSDSSFHHSCFSFSDDSGSLCCDVLRFDFRIIRSKIRVLAWNFVPFKQCGGLLEIIKWEFLEGLSSGDVGSFPLRFDGSVDCEKDGDKKAKYCAYGVLSSVSPVSFVRCPSESVSKNLSAFIVEILVCNCELCKSNDCLKDNGDLVLERNSHDFCTIKYVYFCGVSVSWYPVFLKLVGSVILLVGLRKKLVYIGKEEAGLMFVSNEMTCLRVPSLNKNEDYLFRNGKARRIKGKGELGMYVGVVRGIYMQGMVVELDEEVWLLLTDESLLLPHSVRVGSIVSVRNVHIVSIKFQWGKVLILGACCKTNISTVLFSPLETGCQPVLQTSSLLRKFLESLVFPARLWLLLLVQCLRKKFSGVFSEKEILGTKNMEGLVQTHARFILPSLALQSRHGSFKEFCKHDLCGSGSDINCGSISLAMPFSILVKYCECIWVKSLLRIRNSLKILEGCRQFGHPVQESRSSDQVIRRILPSKDIGVSLLGNLKICPSTGRMQFVDATGSIDAVIPDISSTWDVNAIYEVYNYNLVLEGTPEMWGQFLMRENALFSCGSFFKTNMTKGQAELKIFVHMSWSNVCLRNFANFKDLSSIDVSAKIDPGTYHLLFIAHKFPFQRQFHNDLPISRKSSLFAEVMVFPWDLNVATSDECLAFLTKMPKDDLQNGYQNGFAFKRCKTHQSSIDEVGLCNNSQESEKRSCGQPSNFSSLPHKTRKVNNLSNSSIVQVPCEVSGREIHGHGMAVPGILSVTQNYDNCNMLCSRSSKKVLLEFDAKSFFKYKLLEIGSIYIVKHFAEKCFCDSHCLNQGSSISVTSKSSFFSTSFHFNEAVGCMSIPCHNSSSASRCTSEKSNGFYLHNELILSSCSSADYGTYSDVIVHVGADANGFLDAGMGFQAFKKLVLNLSQRSEDVCKSDQQGGCGNTALGFVEKQGMCSRNGLPEGNLKSIQGTVVSLCNSDRCSVDKFQCNGVANNFHQPRFYEENEGSTYTLSVLLTDGHLVEICGRLSKLDFPVGLGPGAVVIFHRILEYSGKNCLMLTPVSSITVKSVREIPSASVNSHIADPEEKITSCLISDLVQIERCQPRSFCCSVVAVYFVKLERNGNLDKLFSHFHSGKPVVNIPLAGFILDDGSSQCCCWTNGENAAKFLRLNEENPQAGYGSSCWRLNASVRGSAIITPNNQLPRILKKHGRVCVKNYGMLHDTSSRDIQLSVDSDEHFGSQDEKFLKCMMLNACSSTLWNVIGHRMNFNALRMLENNLLAEQMTMHALQNVWAKEVCQVDPLAQAKVLLQQL